MPLDGPVDVTEMRSAFRAGHRRKRGGLGVGREMCGKRVIPSLLGPTSWDSHEASAATNSYCQPAWLLRKPDSPGVGLLVARGSPMGTAIEKDRRDAVVSA